MPGSSSHGIFLSYRREDAAPYARLLQFQLRERFPDAQVFMDLDSIEPGLDFAEVIQEAVGSCAVLVALIGRQWVTLADEGGNRRLDDPGDYVRFEVQTALERGIRVIPVLVDGASPLRQQQLPSELQKLARLNAHRMSYDRYQYDADQLLDLIQRVLAALRDREEVGHKPQEGELRSRIERARWTGETGDAAGARDQLAALVPTVERMLGPEHPETLTARSSLAHWTGRAGDAAAARDQLAALVPVVQRVFGPEHPETLTSRRYLAHWTGRAGDGAAARDQHAALVRAYEQVRGPEHPETLSVRSNLAVWTEDAGDAT